MNSKKKFIALFAIILSLAFATPSFAKSGRECSPVGQAINPTEAQATDDFINLTDGTFGTTHAVEDEYIVPATVKAWSIRAVVDVAPSADDEWKVSLVDDGTVTALTCTIADTATVCNSASDVAVTVDAGSKLTIVVDSGEGAGVPATAAELLVSLCFDY